MDTFSDRFGEKFPLEGKERKGGLTGADGRTNMRVSEGCFAEGEGNVHSNSRAREDHLKSDLDQRSRSDK